MRWRRFLVPALLGFAAYAHAGADDAPLTIRTPSLFSYVAPAGWTSQVGPSGAKGGFPQAVGPASHNFTPDITFVTDGYHALDAFVKSYRPTLVDLDQPFPLKLVDSKPFVTASGAKGYRLHSIDPATPPVAEQFSYVFLNPDGLVFEFACACAPADANRDGALFDGAMKTARILKLGE